MLRVRTEKASGSFTIEASLLMPFLLLIVIWVIYAACYLHDQIVVQAQVQRMLVQLSTVTDQEAITQRRMTGKQKDQITKTFCVEIQERAFLAESVEISLEQSGQKLTAEVSEKMRIPFPWVKKMLNHGELSWKDQRRIHDPVRCVRVQFLLLTKMKQTKVYEKLQEVLAKVREQLE